LLKLFYQSIIGKFDSRPATRQIPDT